MNITTEDRANALDALLVNGLTTDEAEALLAATERDYRTHGTAAAMVAYDLESNTYTVASMRETS